MSFLLNTCPLEALSFLNPNKKQLESVSFNETKHQLDALHVP